MAKEVFSTFQAADYCSVHYGTVKNWIKNGILKSYKTPGGHYRINKTDLDAFLLQHGMIDRGNIPSSETGKKEGKTQKSLKILIIDDDYTIREGIAKTLSKIETGYEIKTAADGYEAGKIIPNFSPDLVILDIIMPWMDGFDVCERIRNILPSQTKIICLTGFPGNGNEEKILQSGADICLTKPVERKDLINTIQNLFKPEA